MKNTVLTWTYDPSDYLHKYKMAARDSMLGDLISTCLNVIRRLPNRFIGECSGYFTCLCVVHWFVNAFVHQRKICIYRFIWQSFNHHIQFWQVGNLAIVIWNKPDCLLKVRFQRETVQFHITNLSLKIQGRGFKLYKLHICGVVPRRFSERDMPACCTGKGLNLRQLNFRLHWREGVLLFLSCFVTFFWDHQVEKLFGWSIFIRSTKSYTCKWTAFPGNCHWNLVHSEAPTTHKSQNGIYYNAQNSLTKAVQL